MTRASRTLLVLAAASAAATLWGPAAAAPLPDPDLFAFPGSSSSPPSAVSAGLALADRWLADEPFDDAAAALTTAASGSALMLRTNRQDLRAPNNDYTDTSAFFDAAGGWAAFSPRHRRWGVAVYASQPVVRREEVNFVHGEAGAPTAPFGLQMQTESREARVGLALAARVHGVEFGVAPEWTSHSDRFVRDELSAGGPTAGTTNWDYSGSGVGFNASARGALPATVPGHVRVGVGVRYVPELAMDGTIVATADGPEDALSVTRASAWEGGVSVAAALSPTFTLTAGAGGRAATEWSGLAAKNGASVQYSIAGEYHDAEVPWRARFGIGRDSNPGTPEASASVFGLGLGWVDHQLSYDVGLLHRGLQRGSAPTSSDDRVVGSVTYRFGLVNPAKQ
jgi:hypothetical protein